MSHSHTNRWRPQLFRAFVTNQYFENRDEYESYGQKQPHTFEQYVRDNLDYLRKEFKKNKKETAHD